MPDKKNIVRNNLVLLQKYRKKMALVVSLIITILIAIGIITTGLFMFSSSLQSDNDDLKIKLERVTNVIRMRQLLNSSQTVKFDDIFGSVITHTRIADIQGNSLVNNIPEIALQYPFKEKEFVNIGNMKYYSAIVTSEFGNYFVTVGKESYNIFWVIVQFMLSVIAVLIAAYFLVRTISLKIVDIFFIPIQELVHNLEDFTSNINHEFKTSLAEVISSLELSELTHQYEKPVKQSIVAAKRMNQILDSLGHMVYFVNSNYRKEQCDIVDLVEKGLMEFVGQMESKNIILKRKYNRNKKIIRLIDHEPLLLVFRNIFKNAIRYSHESGKIELSITHESIIIKDYGVGIAEENLQNVFSRYFREDYAREGSGIGLALAKKIADRYNWTIDITSKKDAFTEVSIKF